MREEGNWVESLLGGRTGFLGGSTNRAELGRDVALERGVKVEAKASPGGDKEKDKIERRRRDSVTEGGGLSLDEDDGGKRGWNRFVYGVPK